MKRLILTNEQNKFLCAFLMNRRTDNLVMLNNNPEYTSLQMNIDIINILLDKLTKKSLWQRIKDKFI